MSDQPKRALAAMRWKQAVETLQDALLLMRQGGSGRSVVNRAYYAAFYAVTALLELDGRTAGKHSGIVSLFDVEYVKSGKVNKSVSKRIHALFERRQEDDYARIDRVSHENAQEAAQDAAEIMNAVHCLLVKALPGLPLPPNSTA